MSKRLLSAILLSLFAIGQSAYAKQPKELSTGGSGHRTSNTGAIFTRDTSNPALGEAYKDPSGLIWGSIVMEHGDIAKMSQDLADKYCKKGRARLPTEEEIEQLATYLGHGTANGYSPYLSDGETDLLPGLSGSWFWSSHVSGADDYLGSIYSGYNGDGVVRVWRIISRSAVRCVAGR